MQEHHRQPTHAGQCGDECRPSCHANAPGGQTLPSLVAHYRQLSNYLTVPQAAVLPKSAKGPCTYKHDSHAGRGPPPSSRQRLETTREAAWLPPNYATALRRKLWLAAQPPAGHRFSMPEASSEGVLNPQAIRGVLCANPRRPAASSKMIPPWPSRRRLR